jgi:GTP-binding protein EngB required for normal cell division
LNPEHFIRTNNEADAYILFYTLKTNSQIIITKINKIADVKQKTNINQLINDISMQSIKSTTDSYMSVENINSEVTRINLNEEQASNASTICQENGNKLFFFPKN